MSSSPQHLDVRVINPDLPPPPCCPILGPVDAGGRAPPPLPTSRVLPSGRNDAAPPRVGPLPQQCTPSCPSDGPPPIPTMPPLRRPSSPRCHHAPHPLRRRSSLPGGRAAATPLAVLLGPRTPAPPLALLLPGDADPPSQHHRPSAGPPPVMLPCPDSLQRAPPPPTWPVHAPSAAISTVPPLAPSLSRRPRPRQPQPVHDRTVPRRHSSLAASRDSERGRRLVVLFVDVSP